MTAEYWAKNNAPVIEQARKNDGKTPNGEVIILHTIGAKSGREHVIPLMYLKDGDCYVVFASVGGAPQNPAWYHNLVAHPDIDIEVGSKTVPVRARVTEGAERDELFARQVARHSFYAGFQKKTKRIIPVVALEPRTQ
ncbi:MAG: nitroreductase family deazaflavin-dependent oxidoreductase [Dehalococcoidia bacterium]